MRFLSEQDKTKMMLVQEEPRGPSQLIEVPVTANGLSKINFPDVANLRNQSDQIIIIKALRLVPVPALSNGPVTGFANAPLTEIVKCTAVLYCEGWEKAQLMPLADLIDIFIEGSGFPWKSSTTKFDSWRNLDWNKSFIQFSNGTVSAGQPYAFLFESEYVKMRIDSLNPDGSQNLVEIVGPA